MSTHKFTFTMWLYRGRMEREHEIEVAYGYTPPIASTMEQPAEGDVVEIISVTGVEYTTRDEDEIIQEEAERRALDDYIEWTTPELGLKSDADLCQAVAFNWTKEQYLNAEEA